MYLPKHVFGVKLKSQHFSPLGDFHFFSFAFLSFPISSTTLGLSRIKDETQEDIRRGLPCLARPEPRGRKEGRHPPRHHPPLQGQIKRLREAVPGPRSHSRENGTCFLSLGSWGSWGQERGAQGQAAFGTWAPRAAAALVRAVHVPAGSIVPSCGTYRVPYRSSTFISGYSAFVSAGLSTWDSTPYALPN